MDIHSHHTGALRPKNVCMAGDVGGTKVDLVLFHPSHGVRNPLVHSRYPTGEYPDFESILTLFLDSIPGSFSVSTAAFGVAGPVLDGRTKITNLDWEISEAAIEKRFSISNVRLINDLVAIAEAVPHLQSEECLSIHQGESVPGGALAVIAPGTGLGEAFLVWNDSEYRSYPSEGGHADFAPMDELQRGLYDFLHDRYGHVSYERICSGMALPDIVTYLRRIDYAPCQPETMSRIESANDRTPLIIEEAMKSRDSCSLCREALNIFVSALGAEAGNLALKVLATGGLYLGGGLPPRILPFLKHETFLHSFRDKGRFFHMLDRIPITVINHPNAALLGAGHRAQKNLI